MIKNYLKIAWRNIKKHKGFSAINGGGLTLGIASCMLLMLYVTYHLNYDHQFKNLDNIYIVENNQPADGKIYTFSATPGQAAAAIKNEAPGVVHSARAVSYSAGGLLTYNNNSFKKNGLFADPDFFSIFSYNFIKGDAVKSLTQVNSIIITRDLAQTLFGNSNPMGKIITRNNKAPLMVTGVIENIPANESYQFDFVIPYAQFEAEQPWTQKVGWGSNFCQTYVQLKDAASLNRANAILAPMVAKHTDGDKNQLFLFPVAKVHLYDKFDNGKLVGGTIDQIHLFEVLALCILLIACVNFMNLSTARSEERAKEVGIRKAIGSGRSSLIWQFIVESLMLSIASTIIAVVILLLCVPYFNELLQIKMAVPINEWSTWIIIISIGLITGLISGSYPAFYLSSFEPIKVLKGRFKGGKSALPVRKILVVVQFAFAIFLITATICIYRQIQYVQNMGNGYNQNNLVEIPVEGNLDKKSDVLINELKEKGAITNATQVSLSITGSGNNTWGVDWPGKDPNSKILFDILNTGYDFTNTIEVKLVGGRNFSAQYPLDTAGKTVMVNEAAVAIMHLKNPVGAQIKYQGMPVTIVGVYKDFVRGSPYEKVPPMISQYDMANAVAIAMRLNPANSITANIDQINKSLKSINPAYPPVIHFVNADFEKKFKNERVLGMLSNIFGGLAIIISCLGLFGLAAHAAEQRTKEIGVRKVLGATVTGITALLSKDFLILVACAIPPAVGLSVWLLNDWLEKYQNRIALSWWIMALASVITIIIALITVSFQAIKAALANPVKSLRSE
jgi:ABC-type antimicrobial peptide transport system permease subunit